MNIGLYTVNLPNRLYSPLTLQCRHYRWCGQKVCRVYDRVCTTCNIFNPWWLRLRIMYMMWILGSAVFPELTEKRSLVVLMRIFLSSLSRRVSSFTATSPVRFNSLFRSTWLTVCNCVFWCVTYTLLHFLAVKHWFNYNSNRVWNKEQFFFYICILIS